MDKKKTERVPADRNFGDFDIRNCVFVGRHLNPAYFTKLHTVDFGKTKAMSACSFSVGRLRRDVFRSPKWGVVEGCPVPSEFKDGEPFGNESMRMLRHMFSRCVVDPDMVKQAVSDECEKAGFRSFGEAERLRKKSAALRKRAAKILEDAAAFDSQADEVSRFSTCEFIRSEAEKADLSLNVEGK